jgi:hypothetical protein
MKPDRRLPVVATWLLAHLTARYQRDALIGDLIEEYRQGRSAGWYWRQTLLAMLAAARTGLPRRITIAGLSLVLYSSLWVALAVLLKSAVPLVFLLDPVFIIRHHARRRRGAEAARRAAGTHPQAPRTQ